MRSVRSDAACIACADSYYQPTAGQASCIECALGSQTEGGASQWVTSGAVACDACDSGQYGSTIAVSGITDPVVKCLDCPEGQSQPTTQQTSCVNCGAGQYQPGTGHASCIPCAAGSQTEDGKPHYPGRDLGCVGLMASAMIVRQAAAPSPTTALPSAMPASRGAPPARAAATRTPPSSVPAAPPVTRTNIPGIRTALVR